MAFRARDGRPFGNRQKMQAYNERLEPRERGENRTATPAREAEQAPPPKPTPPIEAGGPPAPPERGGGNPTTSHEATPDEPRGDEGRGEGDDISHMDIQDAVREHGPADHITIRHSGAGHSVTSMHDGRVHRSSHSTSMGAHMHAADAAGLGSDSAPGPADVESQNAPMIPGLAP